MMTDKNEDRVAEWEAGLPSGDDLPPLSQPLIPPCLASAFKISPEPPYTLLDVYRASQDTLSSLYGSSHSCDATTNGCLNFMRLIDDKNGYHHRKNPLTVRDHEMAEEEPDEPGQTIEGSNPKKSRRMEPAAAVSATRTNAMIKNCMDDQSVEAKTPKRARLVWTPQLHKRFVEVVAHLGLENAVPKSIVQLMNVEGLTRENVASHLQKYRLYVKRMEGLSNEAPSASDTLFASMPVPNESSSGGGGGGGGNGHCGGDKANNAGMPIPMRHPPPSLPFLSMPMMGMGFNA